ncbi:hypothetical protein [Peribacillus asahii]|uniref:Uncharacterized protein n=1 Tax=Peribacillus asahii TaxID=228899 RepID=A0A3Q9RPA5_9BACI|nr:hypothetical protein [Peribacillus asahii]AZV44080.1 hypothetical protein BAOM_3471 [Peribacillus asahii]USK83803.1 hypothetical protein LIT35_15310 [Peribacillus asahii]
MIRTYRDLIEFLNTEGERIKTAAKKLPFGEKRIRVLLKDAGYSFDKSIGKWRYTGEGQAPNDELLLGKPREEETETLPSAQPTKEQVAPAVFTSEQVAAIQEILREYLANATPYSPALHERVMELPRENWRRVTLQVDASVLNKIDKLAQRTWIDKAALVTLALSDFANRYEE